MEGVEEAKENVENGLRELRETNPQTQTVVNRLEEEYERINQNNRAPSYWDKMLEWFSKVKQTLSDSKVVKGLDVAGRKIVNGILKVVDYLAKLFKKKGPVVQKEEAATKIQSTFRGHKARKAVGKHSVAVLQQEQPQGIQDPRKAHHAERYKQQQRKPKGLPRGF